MNSNVQVDVFIPARLDSTRLPRKQLRTINNKAMIWYLVERMSFIAGVDNLVMLTTERPIDDDLVSWSKNNGLKVFRGDANDLLKRFRNGARELNSDLIVRANGDNPLLSPQVTELGLKQIKKNKLQFVTGKNKYTGLPIGIGPEIIEFDLLEDLVSSTNDPSHREHVTSFIFENPDSFHWEPIQTKPHWKAPQLRLTVDTKEDFESLKHLIENLSDNPPSQWSISTIIQSCLKGTLSNEDEH